MRLQLCWQIIFGMLLSVLSVAQECPPALQWQPVQRNNVIEWEKFPNFSLPFTLVYEGLRFGDTQSQPLKHGFSHLASLSGNESNTLPVGQRAITWYHVATDANTQPWADRTLKSPWANDLDQYRATWDTQLRNLADNFAETQGKNTPAYDLIALDIERIHDTDREILGIKNNSRVPANYRNLSDAAFVERYKRDLQRLYAAPIDFARTRVTSSTKWGSYSDAPVRGSFTNWLSLSTIPWKDWTTDPNFLLHVMRDTLTTKVGGAFYNQLSVLTPSCYYYYDYNTSPLGKDYLAYLLFVIEANRAWSEKPVIPYIWLRYHDAFNPTVPFVPNFIAEATAIFPFFSGAKGLWLWEAPFDNSRQENYATYEYFIAALYRLSQFKSFFEGNYELIIPRPGIEYATTKTPIWRGVVKGSEILIAAQNPYSTSDTQETQVSLSYQSFQKTITLKGREVFLCKFPYSTVAAIAPQPALWNLVVAPNPVLEKIKYQFESEIEGIGMMKLTDLTGRILAQGELNVAIGKQHNELPIGGLPTGMYLLKIQIDNHCVIQKILIHQ
ncbi:MAG: T9SS type A sorting domain-containing protein [Spirosomataceae bacterium]